MTFGKEPEASLGALVWLRRALLVSGHFGIDLDRPGVNPAREVLHIREAVLSE
jgi:hypothetical protein